MRSYLIDWCLDSTISLLSSIVLTQTAVKDIGPMMLSTNAQRSGILHSKIAFQTLEILSWTSTPSTREEVERCRTSNVLPISGILVFRIRQRGQGQFARNLIQASSTLDAISWYSLWAGITLTFRDNPLHMSISGGRRAAGFRPKRDKGIHAHKRAWIHCRVVAAILSVSTLVCNEWWHQLLLAFWKPFRKSPEMCHWAIIPISPFSWQ